MVWEFEIDNKSLVYQISRYIDSLKVNIVKLILNVFLSVLAITSTSKHILQELIQLKSSCAT